MRGGLSRETVLEISKRKNDPEWMRDFRLKCLEEYEKQEMPKWGPNLDGLNVDDIVSYTKPRQAMVDNWDKVPEDIRQTFEDLGIPEAERVGLAGVGAQFDSELVYHNIKAEVAEQGVVYLGIEEALRGEYEQMIREHFMDLVKPSDHKFAALHGAVWSGGSFVYVPPNISVSFPLQSYFRFNAPGAGQFEHTLIIVDEGADLHFVEGCSAPKYNIANLHAGCVEIFVRKGAHVKYSTVENWSKNMYNLNTKRALVEEGGSMEWISGSFGSKVSMLYPTAVLKGANSTVEYTGVSFASEDQDLDTGATAIHLAPNTRSHFVAKSLVKGGGKNTFRSCVKILENAKNATSYADCQSLMLDDLSTSDTLPLFDVRRSDADVAHEASIGKIDENKVSYLCGRGISEAEARALIVRGFASPISKELPFEYAMEMNNLLKLEVGEKR